ncbi:hypothetical protein GPN2_22519 [Streptomyces murinus]
MERSGSIRSLSISRYPPLHSLFLLSITQHLGRLSAFAGSPGAAQLPFGALDFFRSQQFGTLSMPAPREM